MTIDKLSADRGESGGPVRAAPDPHGVVPESTSAEARQSSAPVTAALAGGAHLSDPARAGALSDAHATIGAARVNQLLNQAPTVRRDTGKAREVAKPTLPGYLEALPPDKSIEQVRAEQSVFLKERIARLRVGMRIGAAEQAAATSLAGKFAALLTTRIAPPPENWRSPEWALDRAEVSLADDHLEYAKMFVDMAERDLESTQKSWSEYSARYRFGGEVIAPVAWKAGALLSFGIVDKNLFKAAEEAAASKDATGFWKGLGLTAIAVAKQVAPKVLAALTFGGGPPAIEAVEKYWHDHPNDPIANGLLAGGKGALNGVYETLLPAQEFATIAGERIKDPDSGVLHDPDGWEKLEACFSALLKVASLGDMALGEARARGGGSSAPAEAEVHPKTGLPPSGLELEHRRIPARMGGNLLELTPEQFETPASATVKETGARTIEPEALESPTPVPGPALRPTTGARSYSPGEIRSASVKDGTRETGARTIEPKALARPPAVKEPIQQPTGAREVTKAQFKDTPSRGQRGAPSGQLSGTGRRVGRHFHEWNAAEIVFGQVVEYDVAAGRPVRVRFRVEAATKGTKQTTTRHFVADPSVEGAQSKKSEFKGTGLHQGHLQPRRAVAGYSEAERDVDLYPNVVPMAAKLNIGKWAAAETEAFKLAQQAPGGAVTVDVEPIYADKPPTLSNGTPIPKRFIRTTRTLDGHFIKTEQFNNY